MTSRMAADSRRVGVTGAGGFIGGRLCRRLAKEGFEVAGIDLDASRARAIEATGADFRGADTTDPDGIAAALSDCGLVVHTAAIVSEWGRWGDFVRVNVGGTRNVLDAAERAGAERVVHVSSVAVWGCDFRRELGEDEPPHPYGNPYVDTKGASEVIARHHGAVVVRPGDVYGPGSAQWSVRLLEGVRQGLLRLPARGLITPVYVDDLVDALFRALTASGARGPYTAWDGNAVSPREFARHYARMLGKDDPPTGPMPVLRAAAAALELAARVTGKPPLTSQFALDYITRTHAYSTTRAREELGWEPAVSLEEGMRRTEDWFRAEGLL
jgi:nucleoside-diphosphate-sugar epimerase